MHCVKKEITGKTGQMKCSRHKTQKRLAERLRGEHK